MMTIKPIITTDVTARQIVDELLTDPHANWTTAQAYILADHLIGEVIANNEPLAVDLASIRKSWKAYDNARQAVKDNAESLGLSEDDIRYMDDGEVLVAILDNFLTLECGDNALLITNY